jgi:transposase
MKQITLTQNQTKFLSDLTHASTSPQGIVSRAGLLLDYAVSGNKTIVASKHGVGRDTVRRWCDRWQEAQPDLDRLEAAYTEGLLSAVRYRRELEALLTDALRPGHPTIITEEQKARIIALATDKPENANVPITHWTGDTLKDAVIAKGIVPTISRAHVSRFLKQGRITAASEQVLGEPEHR